MKIFPIIKVMVTVQLYSVFCISQTVKRSPTAMRSEYAIWCASSPAIGITPAARSIASRDRKNLAIVFRFLPEQISNTRDCSVSQTRAVILYYKLPNLSKVILDIIHKFLFY